MTSSFLQALAASAAAVLAFGLGDAHAADDGEPPDDDGVNDLGRAPDPTRDGLVAPAPAVPGRGIVRATARGGAISGSGVTGEGIVTWAFARRFAATASAFGGDLAGAPIAPSVAAHVQLLTQKATGLHMTATLRYRTLGMELAGSTVDARLAVGRSFGPVLVTTNALVGRGIGVREDVDFEAGGAATVKITSLVRAGAESRVHGELHETYVTVEDEGRPVGVVAGGTVALAFDRTYVQGLGGVTWPRGPLPAGPAGLVSAGVDF